MGERFLVERLLEGCAASDLLLYDRGFPSYALFALHQARGILVCMRLPRRFNAQVDQFIDDNVTESEIILKPSSTQCKDAKALGIKAVPVRLRLICVRLKSGGVEVLATSLSDKERSPAHLFKDPFTPSVGTLKRASKR